MAKLIVSTGIKIDDIDISAYCEPAINNDKRKTLVFSDGNNQDITKNDYTKSYVRTYNSEKISPKDAVNSSNYQFKHSLYLGKIANEHMWLVRKGCRPRFHSILSSSTAGDYSIVRTATGITVNSPTTGPVSYSNFVIQLAVGGAGGGGHGGTYDRRQMIVVDKTCIVSGAKGGDGALFFAVVDMTQFTRVDVKVGAGGKGSSGDTSAGNGADGYIIFTHDNGTTSKIVIAGGKAGGRYSIFDHDYPFSGVVGLHSSVGFAYPKEHGAAGTISAVGGISGLYNVYAYNGGEVSSFSVKDDTYEGGAVTIATNNIGGAGGSTPSKPIVIVNFHPYSNKTKGANGGNGFIRIFI